MLSLRPIAACVACASIFAYSQAPQNIQDSLFTLAVRADSAEQFTDAISFYQQALLYPGTHSDDIRIALQAYAEVLQMPQVAPAPEPKLFADSLHSTQAQPIINTDSIASVNSNEDSLQTEWSGSATLGGSLSKTNVTMSNGTAKEPTRSLSADVETDFSIYSGIFSHTFTGEVSYDGGFVKGAKTGAGSDTSVSSSQTYDPSIAYSLGIGRFSFGVTGDYLKVKGDTATIGVSLNSSYILVRTDNIRWNVSGSYSYNPAYAKYFSVSTTVAKRGDLGLIAKGGVGFAGSISSMSPLDLQVPVYDNTDSLMHLAAVPNSVLNSRIQKLYATEMGPMLNTTLGYNFSHCKFQLSGSATILQALHKDMWKEFKSGNVSAARISGYRAGPAGGLHAVVPITDVDSIKSLYSQGLIDLPQYTELTLHTMLIGSTDSTTDLFAVLKNATQITTHTYVKQDLSASISALFAYSFNDYIELDLEGTYSVQQYLSMPTDHPQYSGTQYNSLTAQLSLNASF